MTHLLSMLGWRNLWRNPRRTIIMLTALSIGVWAMIWMTAILRGMVDQMVEDSINNLSGHIQIHAPDFRDDPSITNSLTPPTGKLLQQLQQEDIVAWSIRLRLPAMVSSERHTFPVTIVGIDPEQERDLSFIMKSEVQGKMLQHINDKGLIIGKKLLDKLETGINKRVVVMSQDKENILADRGFKITGVFKAKMQALEAQYIFVGLHTLQNMLNCPQCVSEISLKTTQYLLLDELKSRISHYAGNNEVMTWFELDPYTETMLDSMNGFILILIVVIFLALSFGLVNTLVMAIFERGHEIALIHALGLAPKFIAILILIESGFLILIGLGTGNALALLSLWPIQDGIDISIVGEGLDMAGMSSVLKPSLLLSDVFMANVIVIILGTLACLLPAWRVAQKAPAAALNRSET